MWTGCAGKCFPWLKEKTSCYVSENKSKQNLSKGGLCSQTTEKSNIRFILCFKNIMEDNVSNVWVGSKYFVKIKCMLWLKIITFIIYNIIPYNYRYFIEKYWGSSDDHNGIIIIID